MILGESGQVGQGCQCFLPAETCPPWPVTAEAHIRASKGGQDCCSICFGSKDATKDTRDPPGGPDPLSSFSVISYHCYLAPDMSPKVTFDKEILIEMFKARTVWHCWMNFGGKASRYD